VKSFLKNRRLLLIGLAAFAIAALAVPDHPDKSEDPASSWPYNQSDADEISLSDAWELVDLKHLEDETSSRVGILDDYVYIEVDDHTVRAKVPYPSTGLIADFMKFSSADLRIYENTSYKRSLFDRVMEFLPILLLIGILIFFFARGVTKSLGLSSGFEIVEVDDLTESFDDVAGIDNARDDIQEIIEFLKNPKQISSLGGRMPRGALLCGPPGTGKTLLSRALAKEAGVPFLRIDASGVNQIFVGAGAMKLGKAFQEARKIAPCIVFIDEIDALGRARSGSNGPGSGASDEKESTLNTLLVEMDGFDTRDGIFILAATNRDDVLDPALTRAGRLDRKIHFTLPDVKGRTEILDVNFKRIKVAEDISAADVARMTPGFSGADLALLADEAAIAGARRSAAFVEMEDFLVARDRSMIGRSSSSRQLSGAARETTAYHEAGHGYIAHIRTAADPIERLTILPTGGALGHLLQLPEDDMLIETKARIEARIDVAVAGRVAEVLFKGEASSTTGVESDVQIATQLARGMVQKWAMSDLGFMAIGDDLDPLHRGSTRVADEVAKIISAAYDRTLADMKKRKAAVERIAKALLEHETLNAEQIELLVRNRQI